jgi:hypothetical protein
LSPLAVASSSDGGFVVVWDSWNQSGADQDGSSYGVFARRYDSSGATTGPDFGVNSYTTGGQRNGTVAAQPDGGFVVVWQSLGIFGQRISNDPDLIFADGFEASSL